MSENVKTRYRKAVAYLNGKLTLDYTYEEYENYVYTAVTDTNGEAVVNLTRENLPDGVYLIVEKAHAAIVAPVDPFYVIVPATSADGSLTISKENGNGNLLQSTVNTIFVEGSDYILKVNDVDSLAEGKPSDSFTIELTPAGMAKAGAVFQLYRPATVEELNDDTITKVTLEGMETQFVLVEFFDTVPVIGTEEKVTSVSSNADGKVVIYGLAYGDYYLVETKAPAGYNLLSALTKIVIDAESHTDAKVVKILNNSGMELPETGGMGTTIFMTAGLILGAGVLLVTRRRMGLD